MAERALEELHREITACRACPRLVEWREQVAREKRAAFRDWTYWGRPVPGFGDPRARLVLIGLAPAAHGGNRTGRTFTGDRSGDFLYAALFRKGFANQPTSVSKDDGLALRDCFITAPVRCAPPANAPAPGEIARCAPFMDREIASLPRARVFLALGAIAWNAFLAHWARVHGESGSGKVLARPRFAHGATWAPEASTQGGTRGPVGPVLLGSYHVSQQNTQTGRLTPAMFDAVLDEATRLMTHPINLT